MSTTFLASQGPITTAQPTTKATTIAAERFRIGGDQCQQAEGDHRRDQRRDTCRPSRRRQGDRAGPRVGVRRDRRVRPEPEHRPDQRRVVISRAGPRRKRSRPADRSRAWTGRRPPRARPRVLEPRPRRSGAIRTAAAGAKPPSGTGPPAPPPPVVRSTSMPRSWSISTLNGMLV